MRFHPQNDYDLRCAWCDLRCRNHNELSMHERQHRLDELKAAEDKVKEQKK